LFETTRRHVGKRGEGKGGRTEGKKKKGLIPVACFVSFSTVRSEIEGQKEGGQKGGKKKQKRRNRELRTLITG